MVKPLKKGTYRVKAEGKNIISAPPAKVWAALHDPAVLRQTLPSCYDVISRPDGNFEALIAHKLGPIQIQMGVMVDLTDIVTNEQMQLSCHGRMRGMGGLEMDLLVHLAEHPTGTQVTYQGTLKPQGIIGRAIRSQSSTLVMRASNRFMQNLAQHLRKAGPQTQPA